MPRTKKQSTEAKLPLTTRLYDLRHSAAVRLLLRNVPVNAVSAHLGHESAKMTLDVYGAVLPSDARDQILQANLEALGGTT